MYRRKTWGRHQPAGAFAPALNAHAILHNVHYAKYGVRGTLRYTARILRDWLRHRLHRPKPSPGNIEACTAWI